MTQEIVSVDSDWTVDRCDAFLPPASIDLPAHTEAFVGSGHTRYQAWEDAADTAAIDGHDLTHVQNPYPDVMTDTALTRDDQLTLRDNEDVYVYVVLYIEFLPEA